MQEAEPTKAVPGSGTPRGLPSSLLGRPAGWTPLVLRATGRTTVEAISAGGSVRCGREPISEVCKRVCVESEN